jgi:hypothetical protein
MIDKNKELFNYSEQLERNALQYEDECSKLEG